MKKELIFRLVGIDKHEMEISQEEGGKKLKDLGLDHINLDNRRIFNQLLTIFNSVTPSSLRISQCYKTKTSSPPFGKVQSDGPHIVLALLSHFFHTSFWVQVSRQL